MPAGRDMGLAKGDRVPHFRVTQVDGVTFDYGSIWQHRSLVLVTMCDLAELDAARVMAELSARAGEFDAIGATAVVTMEVVPGAERSGVVVADRWGVVYATADGALAMTADEMLEWLRFLQFKCG